MPQNVLAPTGVGAARKADSRQRNERGPDAEHERLAWNVDHLSRQSTDEGCLRHSSTCAFFHSVRRRESC